MRRPLIAGLLLAFAILVIPDSLSAQEKKKRGDRMRITQDELVEAAANVNTAADVIRTLRPQWMNIGRGMGASLGGASGGGATEPVLYIDDIRQPSLNELQTVKASSIVEMRFLDQNRAIQMRGPGHEAGAIEITTVNKRQ